MVNLEFFCAALAAANPGGCKATPKFRWSGDGQGAGLAPFLFEAADLQFGVYWIRLTERWARDRHEGLAGPAVWQLQPGDGYCVLVGVVQVCGKSDAAHVGPEAAKIFAEERPIASSPTAVMGIILAPSAAKLLAALAPPPGTSRVSRVAEDQDGGFRDLRNRRRIEIRRRQNRRGARWCGWRIVRRSQRERGGRRRRTLRRKSIEATCAGRSRRDSCHGDASSELLQNPVGCFG